jgi:hypothetical protein
MAKNGLSEQFEKISIAAQDTSGKIRAAGQQAHEQVEADAARARDRASQAADHLKDRAETAHDKASEHWRDFADKWNAHITKVRKDLKKKRDQHDAKEMKVYAEMAEGYAFDAIDFAQAAIYEAEYAVLDALSARAAAKIMAAS